MDNCDHISRIKDTVWKIAEDGKDVLETVVLWDCARNCGAVSDTGWFNSEFTVVDHTKCGGPEVCFGCKAKGLQLNTGDANGSKVMSNKKWDGELDAYRAARAQGIQPNGTSMAQVQAAVTASEIMGSAYDSDTTATPAAMITKESVTSLKEVGVI